MEGSDLNDRFQNNNSEKNSTKYKKNQKGSWTSLEIKSTNKKKYFTKETETIKKEPNRNFVAEELSKWGKGLIRPDERMD